MKRRLVSSLASFFKLLLRLYPHRFREEFGAEMTAVFTQNVEDALDRGGWQAAIVSLRELHDTPQALASVYRYEWKRKWKTGIQILRETTSAADLPPPPPDGRESWRQVGLELSLFVITGLLLLAITYLPLEVARAGWQHEPGLLGKVITPLTLPVFLVGLARGLPRWAYPFGGLLVGYHALRVHQTGLWPFLVIMLLAYAILAAGALLTDPQPSPLPRVLRRIGQSLSLDWTRLSFGVYGATPLAIIMAFDDGHVDNRTPYLALSLLAMVAGAAIYCRSRRTEMQIGALAGGMTLSIWAAWLDMVALAGNSAVPFPGQADLAWMVALWIPWVTVLLIPILFNNTGRVLLKHSA